MGFSKPKAPAPVAAPPTLETVIEDSNQDQITKRKKRRGYDSTLNPKLYPKLETPATPPQDTMPKHTLPPKTNKLPSPLVQQKIISVKKILG